MFTIWNNYDASPIKLKILYASMNESVSECLLSMYVLKKDFCSVICIQKYLNLAVIEMKLILESGLKNLSENPTWTWFVSKCKFWNADPQSRQLNGCWQLGT